MRISKEGNKDFEFMGDSYGGSVCAAADRHFLSGRQLFPLMTIENHTNLASDDRVYGYEKRGNTNFIVTSGISDWAIKFKTGCKSEYLMIEIHE